MRHSRLLPAALAALIYAVSVPAALALPVPEAPLLDASMTANNLLTDCVSPDGSGQHASCLVIVGSIMDSAGAAAIAAQRSHLKPSICIPADLDRQTVVNEFIYLMGAGNGAFEKEKATFLVRGVLTTLYPCS